MLFKLSGDMKLKLETPIGDLNLGIRGFEDKDNDGNVEVLIDLDAPGEAFDLRGVRVELPTSLVNGILDPIIEHVLKAVLGQRRIPLPVRKFLTRALSMAGIAVPADRAN